MIDRYLARFRDVMNAPPDRRTPLAREINQQMTREFRDHPPAAAEVARELERMADGEDVAGPESVLIAGGFNPDDAYVAPLCRILMGEQYSGLHELTIGLLGRVVDDRAVPALAQAVGYRWDYDESLLVPRRALEVLAAIGTPAALAQVRAATAATEAVIREEAVSLLGDFD